MTEGSPPDPSPSSESPEATPATAAPSQEPSDQEIAEAVSGAHTPEEIEAIWRNRVAGKDRAHAAETATLRSQIEASSRRTAELEAQLQQRTTEGLSEAEQWKAKAEAAERDLANERRSNTLQQRTLKYAAAAEALDEATLVGMDEAKLAALNTRLSTGASEGPTPPQTPTPPLDPNQAPRRPSGQSTGPRERSVEELEGDLSKHAPAWMADNNLGE